MVVEPSRYVRVLLKDALRTMGVTTFWEATDGQNALGQLQKVKPDVIITEFDLAAMSGLDLVKALRNDERSPHRYTPIIMVTSSAERRRVLEARDAGVNEYIVKPFSTKQLFGRIMEIVDRPREFVASASYNGPDRRRKADQDYMGPKRRQEDKEKEAAEAALASRLGSMAQAQTARQAEQKPTPPKVKPQAAPAPKPKPAPPPPPPPKPAPKPAAEPEPVIDPSAMSQEELANMLGKNKKGG
ncbi:response regulator [Magnetospira sp. QH-2]|uniref:response regulator n=1 Tax=Magnetospira sp. (strain QH-2) TaxID=1288970 RepID=UPI00130EF1E6|nr:response regulator [Magnetospira sp. QH-2]